MRKYTGTDAHKIASVEHLYPPRWLVKTNNGAAYFLDRCAPAIGDEITWFKYVRAQPMTFEQDVCAFYRILDGYALPFVEYRRPLLANPVDTDIECLSHAIRKQFIEDMTRQNILPRFRETA